MTAGNHRDATAVATDEAPLLHPERVSARLASGDRPYVTLKAAASLDGKIATRRGESQWITGEAARALGHRLRAVHDGILVGIGTVAADDPRLTVRLAEPAVSPVRVVLDSRCRIAPAARCLAADGVRRIVVTGSEADATRVARLRAAGVEVLQCETPRPRPGSFLPRLRALGLSTLLVEGGGQVHADLIANHAVDELFLLAAGTVIGGRDAPGWCASLGVDSLAQAPRLELSAPRMVGADLLLHGIFEFG